jgi:hypothetical protein
MLPWSVTIVADICDLLGVTFAAYLIANDACYLEIIEARLSV